LTWGTTKKSPEGALISEQISSPTKTGKEKEKKEREAQRGSAQTYGPRVEQELSRPLSLIQCRKLVKRSDGRGTGDLDRAERRGEEGTIVPKEFWADKYQKKRKKVHRSSPDWKGKSQERAQFTQVPQRKEIARKNEKTIP